jgi:hypothetical protein
LAGLWRKTIITDLRWTVYGRGFNARRSSIWRSPSWSWAAIDGDIYYQRYDDPDHSDIRDYARCLEASVTPTGPDSTGEVSSGYIVLIAPVMLAPLQNNLYPEEGVERLDRWSLGATGLNVSFSPDCSLDFEDGSLTIGDGLLCLRLGNAFSSGSIYLVLKQCGVNGLIPVCKRVGRFIHGRYDLEEHWLTPKMEDTFVKII